MISLKQYIKPAQTNRHVEILFHKINTTEDKQLFPEVTRNLKRQQQTLQ